MNKEKEILNNLKSSSKRDAAFKELLDMYQERLYWHIRKIVISHENTNDVLQNTFIRVYKSIQNFKGNSSLHTWMYKIAYNESIRFIEKNKLEYNSLSDQNNDYLSNLQQDSYFDGEELHKKLHTVIANLTEKQRTVFQMKYFDDMSFVEIEDITGINESTLKSAYYSAVKAIEKNIIKEEI